MYLDGWGRDFFLGSWLGDRRQGSICILDSFNLCRSVWRLDLLFFFFLLNCCKSILGIVDDRSRILRGCRNFCRDWRALFYHLIYRWLSLVYWLFDSRVCWSFYRLSLRDCFSLCWLADFCFLYLDGDDRSGCDLIISRGSRIVLYRLRNSDLVGRCFLIRFVHLIKQCFLIGFINLYISDCLADCWINHLKGLWLGPGYRCSGFLLYLQADCCGILKCGCCDGLSLGHRILSGFHRGSCCCKRFCCACCGSFGSFIRCRSDVCNGLDGCGGWQICYAGRDIVSF